MWRTVLVVAVTLCGCSGSLISINTGQPTGQSEPDPRIVQTLQQHEQQLRAISQQVEGLKRATPVKAPEPPGKGFREAMEKGKAKGTEAEQQEQKK